MPAAVPWMGLALYFSPQSRHNEVTFIVLCCFTRQSCTFSFVHPQSAQCCLELPIEPKEDFRRPWTKQMTATMKKQSTKICMGTSLIARKGLCFPTVLFFFLSSNPVVFGFLSTKNLACRLNDGSSCQMDRDRIKQERECFMCVSA